MSETNNTLALNDFLTAGLETEGVYRLNITKMAVEEKTVQQGDNAGQKYKTISGIVELIEELGVGLSEGDFAPRVYVNFSFAGKGLDRFRKLYVAAYGQIPTSGVDLDTGQPTVSLDDLAAALVGNDEIWTTYFWKRNYFDKKKIEGSLGWSFSKNSADIKAPRPFAERDGQTQAEATV